MHRSLGSALFPYPNPLAMDLVWSPSGTDGGWKEESRLGRWECDEVTARN